MIKDRRSKKIKSILFKNPKYAKQTDFKLNITEKSLILQNKVLTLSETYGHVRFFFVITFARKNVFFTLYMKSSKVRNRVFVIAKASSGFCGRIAAMQQSSNINHLQRGRVKTNYGQICSRIYMFRRFMYEFFRFHPILKNFICIVIWKVKKIDSLVNRLLAYTKFNPLSYVYEDFKTRMKRNITTKYYHVLDLQLPHGGCRPKKPRRIKKNRAKRANKIKALFNVNQDDLNDLNDMAKRFIARPSYEKNSLIKNCIEKKEQKIKILDNLRKNFNEYVKKQKIKKLNTLKKKNIKIKKKNPIKKKNAKIFKKSN